MLRKKKGLPIFVEQYNRQNFSILSGLTFKKGVIHPFTNLILPSESDIVTWLPTLFHKKFKE
jgi:hypothetical protein